MLAHGLVMFFSWPSGHKIISTERIIIHLPTFSQPVALTALGRPLRVASKVGNLPSKFGHARPLGSRIIRYVRDGQTDRQTDGKKATFIAPFPMGGSITMEVCASIK